MAVGWTVKGAPRTAVGIEEIAVRRVFIGGHVIVMVGQVQLKAARGAACVQGPHVQAVGTAGKGSGGAGRKVQGRDVAVFRHVPAGSVRERDRRHSIVFRFGLACPKAVMGDGNIDAARAGDAEIPRERGVLAGEGGRDQGAPGSADIALHPGTRAVEARQDLAGSAGRRHVSLEEGVVSGEIKIGRPVGCRDLSRDFQDPLGLLVDGNEAFASCRRLRAHGSATCVFIGKDGFLPAVDLDLAAGKRIVRFRLHDGVIPPLGMEINGIGRQGRFGRTCRVAVVGDDRPSPRIGHLYFAVFAARNRQKVIRAIVHNGVSRASTEEGGLSRRYQFQPPESGNLHAMIVGFRIDSVIIGPNRNGFRRSDFAVMAGTTIDDAIVV